jgi:GDP-L-fucose synthase
MRNVNDRVFVAGHGGMVGAAIDRHLQDLGYTNILRRSRNELDLLDAGAVDAFFKEERPDQVYLAAARVGGIHANDSMPADFIWENLVLASNVIKSAHDYDVERLLFLGSSCIYPRNAPQPMREESLLSGQLEPTNEPYAIAKIAGIKLCESFNRQFGRDYRSAMPTNLYGPGDNYHPQNSHVIPALLRRFYEAIERDDRTVTIWGTGNPLREFLHVDDMASASVYLQELEPSQYWSTVTPRLSHVNVGSGREISIRDLASLIAQIAGFEGRLEFDAGRPDGTSRKLMSVERLTALGWQPSITLEDGLREAYAWFTDHETSYRGR